MKNTQINNYYSRESHLCISAEAINPKKFSHFIAYYEQMIHISLHFLDDIKKSILKVIAEFEIKNNLYDQCILNTSLEKIELKIKGFLEDINEFLSISICELKTNLTKTSQAIPSAEVAIPASVPDTQDVLTKDNESARTQVALTVATNRYRFFKPNQNKLSDTPVVDVVSKENNVCLP